MVQRESDEFKITDPAEMAVGQLPPIDRHPGVFIREVVLPQWGLKKVVDLAERLKVNRPNLHEVLSGQRAVSRDLAYRLGALLGDHVADFIIAYQNAWDLQNERTRREELKHEIERLAVPEQV